MIQRNTKVELDGRGVLTLRPSDHVATGGEGSVFRASQLVIKLYSDPAKMQRDGMVDKIRLLSKIKHDFVVAPQGLVKSSAGKPIGYYMGFVDGEPLSRIFTNDFRQRERFGDDEAKTLVSGMREAVQVAHSAGAVMVDANELNWMAVLGGPKGPEPRVIDVDSWAIGKWPATVVMLSIRDWHSKKFNARTDWFAWGIVSFQVFTGIHPYKGKLNGFKPGDMKGRMLANASVFSDGVKLNRAVRDFKCISGPLLDWYFATFQQGERVEPPSPFETGVAAARAGRVLKMVTDITGTLVFEKLFEETGNPVIRVFPSGVALLESLKLVDIKTRSEMGTVTSPDCEVIGVSGGWLRAEILGRQVRFSYIKKGSYDEEELISLPIKGDALLRYENRLFVITEKGLTEIIFRMIGKRAVVSAGNTWGVMVNATRWFDGVGVQDAMGATYVIAPFGDNSATQMRVRELDGIKPVFGKAGNRFITIIGVDKDGNYQKLELTFDRGYTTYTSWMGGTDTAELNIAILPKGVCATIVDDGEIDIFVPTSGALNKVNDKDVATDMTLANWDDKVVYIQNGGLWSLRIG